MKERPILFSGPMVRAILAGTKTQTRRAMKPQPTDEFRVLAVEWYSPEYEDRHGELQPGEDIFGVYGDEEGYKCPYGAPGDRLWVRETWRAPGAVPRSDDPVRPGMRIEYRADEDHATDGFTWRPSIFMPKWACRLVLEIVGVRVERLQTISEADALAEGIAFDKQWEGYGIDGGRFFHCSDPRRSYEQLWESINGEGSWDANPWVWVIEFKPHQQGTDK